MPSERPASALQSGGLPFVLGYMHVNGPAAQKATQVILLCRHGGEKQTSSNRRDRLYHHCITDAKHENRYMQNHMLSKDRRKITSKLFRQVQLVTILFITMIVRKEIYI